MKQTIYLNNQIKYFRSCCIIFHTHLDTAGQNKRVAGRKTEWVVDFGIKKLVSLISRRHAV